MYRLRQGVWGCLHILVRKRLSSDRIVHEWTGRAGWYIDIHNCSQRQGELTCSHSRLTSRANEDELLLLYTRCVPKQQLIQGVASSRLQAHVL